MSSPLNLWRRAEQLKFAAIDPTKSSNEVWINRQSLQEIYMNLLIADLEFSLDKKVEQDLWNFTFKKQITTLQNQCKDKQNQKRGEVQSGLNLFLDAASGFYAELLEDVCSIFYLDLSLRKQSKKFGVCKEYQTSIQKNKVPSKSSCIYLCQDCLVHLGDIARYKQCNDQAQTFYKHAAQLVPMNGQPYNQLAILEVQRGNKLSTIFYHTRSLAVQHPFPVAEINCNKFYARISKDGQESRQKVVANEWLSMFLQFLASVRLELDPMKSRIRLDRILLSFKPNVSSLGFNSQQLLQMVTVLFYEYHSILEKKLKHSGKGHSYCKPTSKEALGLSSRKEGGDTNFREMIDEEEEEEDEFAENDGKVGRWGRILSGVQLTDKELEEVHNKRIDMVLELAGTMMESIFMAANEKEGELKELLLPVVKVMLDWLISNEDVVNHPVILKSGLWLMLCPLANSLISELAKLSQDKNISESHKSMPLPEDRELQCFLPLKTAHCHLTFTWKSPEVVPINVERYLRITRILDDCTALEKMAKKSSGILIANYKVSDTRKALVSFETNVSRNIPEASTVTPVMVERRPARLNVAMQNILQKPSTPDLRTSGRSEGDGESTGKQSKRSLKVEFKETVDDIWKGSDGSQGNLNEDDRTNQQQVVDRNNNNSPHMFHNFHARPFTYAPIPHPPPYFGAPLRPPMYQFYPLPPPPPLPFSFRPGCPLPAPPSMMPRFSPMPSLEINIVTSDSSISTASSKSSTLSKELTFSIEEEFPCLPVRKANPMAAQQVGSPRPLISPALQKPPSKQDSKKECDDEAQRFSQGSFPFPSFKPLHLPFPRNMLNPPGAGMPYMQQPQLHSSSIQSPYGPNPPMQQQSFTTYPNSGQQQGQPHPFYPCGPQDLIGQNFRVPKGDSVTIPPQPSGGCPDSQFRMRSFGQQGPGGTIRPPNMMNHDDNIQCQGRNDSHAVNVYGAQYRNHVRLPPNYDMRLPRPPIYDMRLPRPPSATNYRFQQSSQSGMGILQPCSEVNQSPLDQNAFQPEAHMNTGTPFGMSLPPFGDSQLNCRLSSPLQPPSEWAAGAKLPDCNSPDNLQRFDMRISAQRAMGRNVGPMNLSNCNNSFLENKHGENIMLSPSSYNLFSQSPWHPASMVKSSHSSAQMVNPSTSHRDEMTRFATGKPTEADNSSASGVNGPWKDSSGTPVGQISIMKSTSNAMATGNIHQSIANSTTWSGHQTPLEKLLQQQKQLKPNGS